MANLEVRIALQNSRFYLIQQETDSDKEDNASQTTRQAVSTRLEMLEINWTKFQEEHEELCRSSEFFKEHDYIKQRVFERCQAFYIVAKAKLLSQRDDYDLLGLPLRSETSLLEAPAISRRLSALPRISLLHFSGDYKDWRSFNELFTSLILKNAKLTNVERMHYLKTSLSGEASRERLISNLPITGNHLTIAWDSLVSRYDNKRLLLSMHLDRLTNMKPLKVKSAQGLSTFMVTVTETLGALRELGCLTQYWDPLLLHILVKLLDPETREAWEIRLGSTTTPPSYSNFEDFLVGRSRALQNLSLHSSSNILNKNIKSTITRVVRPNLVAHAAIVTSKGQQSTCPLCKLSHPLPLCPRYQAKPVHQRRELLIAQRRCFNCLGSHTVSNCRSTRRCQKCGRRHHTSIHHLPATSTTEVLKTNANGPNDGASNKRDPL